MLSKKCLVLFSIFVPKLFALKVIVTPRLKNEKGSTASYTKLKNVSTPVLEKLTSCYWFSKDFEDLGSVWATGNKFFGNSIKSDAKYMYVGKVINRFEYPPNISFVPEQWKFFCFSFDNVIKELKVYIDAQEILKVNITKHLESFIIKENFLENEKFGKANQFSGKFTDINIWSTILKKSDIGKKFRCMGYLMK